MDRVRARVEERSRREAAEAAEPQREPATAAAPECDRGAAEPRREGAGVAPRPSELFAFHGHSIYWSSRGGGVGRVLYGIRRALAPLVKFVFNIDPMVDALATQARRNAQQAAFDDDVARRLAAREEHDALNRRAVESLTAEMKRLAADLKSQRTLVAGAVERIDALERARAGEHPAKPRGGRHTDERPDDDAPPSPAADETPAPSDRQADEHPDDDLSASPPAAEASSTRGQADERPDDDLPASPPAPAPLAPNR